MKSDKQKRRRKITDETMKMDPNLMGVPLASPGRRGAALLIDLFLAVIVYFLVSTLIMRVEDPEFYKNFKKLIFKNSDEQNDEVNRAAFDFFSSIARRSPDALTDEIKATLQSGDVDRFSQLVPADSLILTANFNSQKASAYDTETGTLVLRGDVLFGRFNSFLGGAAFFLTYFTIFIWVLNGTSPGKWLLGIRVVRLDGKRIRLWDAFGRAGGYGASMATAFLGFLEAIWHPNRQTVHDRIAGTVVIRKKRNDSVYKNEIVTR